MRRCLTALANSPQSPGPRALGLSNREHRLGGRFTFGHMETGEVGTVQELWRFPVKSMQGERLDAILSRFFSREVRLARSAPADFTIERYHPDIENLDPQGHRDEVTDTKLGSARFRQLGIPSLVPEGTFKDLFPVSVISTSTLNRVGELQPGSLPDI